jgi:hypothetical protein
MFEATGKLIYDPHRPGMKRNTKWWAIVNVDDEIARYYRWWVKKQHWVDLHQPSWGAHISVVRGETISPDKQHLWKKYQGEVINFKYFGSPKKADGQGRKNEIGDFWVIEVQSERLNQIRQELGLRCGWNYHITVGRIWY